MCIRVIATTLHSYRDPIKLDIVFTLYLSYSKPRYKVKKQYLALKRSISKYY